MSGTRQTPVNVIGVDDQEEINQARQIPPDRDQELGRVYSHGRSQKDLKTRKKEDQYKDEREQAKHLNRIKIISRYCFAVIGALVSLTIILVWLIHLLCPERMHWLSDGQISSLGNMVGAILASIGAKEFGAMILKK